MKIYNSLTRKIEEFTPLTDNKTGIYSCGPTVYDHIHIGNLSSFIFADTLRRVLLASGYDVKHVMNFTDVDDKTIRRSQEKYSDLEPIEVLLKLTTEYSNVFIRDMDAVGNDTAVISFVKATDSIEAMRTLIKKLVEAGFAYVTEDGVYFSIEAYKKSGKVYGQLTEITESSTSEARIQNDEYDKESVHDFALWKKQKANEPAWPLEINGQDIAGRPGWHIECSAMSRTALGQPFDIHTGGVDLKFPHHENEIAQSTAAEDNQTYAKYFAHNEHLLVDDQKMSKSLNNFYTLEDIQSKGFDPMAFRLLVLQAHYRKQAHFSWNNLEAAQNRLNNLRAMADLRFQAIDGQPDQQINFEQAKQGILEAMQDDLQTPKALEELSGLEKQLSTSLVDKQHVAALNSLLEVVDNLLGLRLASSDDITAEQYELINAREQARINQQWEESDSLRQQLTDRGIGLRDTPHGAIWYRLYTRQT